MLAWVWHLRHFMTFVLLSLVHRFNYESLKAIRDAPPRFCVRADDDKEPIVTLTAGGSLHPAGRAFCAPNVKFSPKVQTPGRQ